MNTGTKLRTAARIIFSIYTAFCMWQVSIGELSKLLNAPWMIGACAVIIVVCGILVDFFSTYFNNDYTKVAAKHTAEMRQEKRELDPNYIGDRFFTDDIPEEYEETEEGDEDE